MKMRILHFFMCMMFCVAANAQLEMNSKGQILIGPQAPDNPSISESQKDNISAVKIGGPYGGNLGCGSRIAFGDMEAIWNMNVAIGEAGKTDTDRLWLHGKHGTCLTSDPTATDTVFNFNDEVSANFVFYHAISAPQYLVKAASKSSVNKARAVQTTEEISDEQIESLSRIEVYKSTQRAEAAPMRNRSSVS